jgi:hypothetical protein
MRLVTTSEDADVEREAAEATAYELAAPEKIRLSPQGFPDDPTLRDSLPPEGIPEGRFVEPVTIVATITFATLAVRLVNHWMKSQEAGVQVDTRTKPVTISRLAGVPFGTLAVIHPDGSTTIHREAYDSPEDVMGTIAQVLPPE